MQSTKGGLIWDDVKSWLITTGLTLAPISIGFVIQLVQNMSLGMWQSVILLALGSLLKLAQKWATTTA